MPEPYCVQFTMRAADDLEAVFDFVSEDSPQSAVRLVERLLAAIDSLQLLPHRYNVSKGSAALGERIRSMPVRPYLVRYSIDEARRVITILSVRHGARQTD